MKCSKKIWIVLLRRSVNLGCNNNVRQHAKDNLNAIQELDKDKKIRKQFTDRSGNKIKTMLRAFQEWNTEIAPAKKTSRAVDKVTKLQIHHDVLDC